MEIILFVALREEFFFRNPQVDCFVYFYVPEAGFYAHNESLHQQVYVIDVITV